MTRSSKSHTATDQIAGFKRAEAKLVEAQQAEIAAAAAAAEAGAKAAAAAAAAAPAISDAVETFQMLDDALGCKSPSPWNS